MASLRRLRTMVDCPGSLKMPTFYRGSKYKDNSSLIRYIMWNYYTGGPFPRVGQAYSVDGIEVTARMPDDIELVGVKVTKDILLTCHMLMALAYRVTKDNVVTYYYPRLHVYAGDFEQYIDCVYIDKSTSTLHIFCYELGYDTEDRTGSFDKKIMAYLAGNLFRQTDWEKAFIHDLWPLKEQTYTTEVKNFGAAYKGYNRDDIISMVNDISGGPLKPGSHCAKCAALANCPAAYDYIFKRIK